MTCRDVREVAESFLSDELLTETNHEILRHLETCPSCRADMDARRRLRSALRGAFDRAPELQPRAEFTDRLREQLREAGAHTGRRWGGFGRWLAMAAALVILTGLAAAVFLHRPLTPAEALAEDAIGDHRYCALTFRLIRHPIPLEDAARQFDRAYRLLIDAPPVDVATPDGTVHVVERHACLYDDRRFGHVVLQYRGHVVSLLMTATEAAASAAEPADAGPHVLGRRTGGLSVVSVNGPHHAILLVSDLDSAALTELSRVVSVPLAERLEGRLISIDVSRLATLFAAPSR